MIEVLEQGHAVSYINVRPVRLEDLQQARVLGRAFYDEATLCHNAEYTEQKLINLLAIGCEPNDKVCFFVAEQGEDIVGIMIGETVEFFFSRNTYATNHVFYVIPRLRGSSAAQKLLKAYVNWAENCLCTDAFLNTVTGIESERTGKFFELMGFNRIGTICKKEL